MDLPVDWNGDLFILEHKTTSVLRGNFFKQFTPNMQITSYIIGAEEYLGRRCVGCVINALEPWKEVKKVSVRTKRMEDHYARDVASRSPKQIANFKDNVQRVVRDILWCEKEGEYYPNESSCFNYNFECPYKQLCVYGDDPRLINRDYNEEKWEPYKEAIKEVGDDNKEHTNK